MKKTNIRTITQLALFSALIIIMAFVPFLGYIPLGPIQATIIHIPVIIGSVILGPAQGGFLGFLFGVTSLVNNTVKPGLTSFVFSPFYSVGGIGGNIWSLVICFIPRILVGILPHYVFKWTKKPLKQTGALALSGLCGSLTNTLLVMHMIFLFFGKEYAAARGIAFDGLYYVILSIIGMNGVPEAIVASILTVVIGRALLVVQKKNRL